MDMQHTVRRNVVKAAVMRAIFCPIGGQVLDIDSAVLVSHRLDGSTSVVGGQAWSRILLDLTPDADKMIIDYSHGMQKKTAVAASIIHAPRVLFLDEPFEGVDAIAGRAIRDVLKQLRQRGTTIFFSSHILEVVERLCTRLAVISDGRIVSEGTIDELRERANAGDQTTLEDLFLKAVGASGDSQGKLSWLD